MIKTFEKYIIDNNEKISTLIIKLSHPDVDPYGEEEWYSEEIEWDKINIVHPSLDKSNIRKKVLIVKDSRYYIDTNSNPCDLIGEINQIIKKHNNPIKVIWSNEYCNAYIPEDLTLINVEYKYI